ATHSVPTTPTTENAGNDCRHPPRTCRTSTCTLYPGRPALDRPHDAGIAEPGTRSDPNRVPVRTTYLSSLFPTCVASPVVSHRNNGEPLVTCPGRTDRQPHDRWQSLTNRGASTDYCQDRWRAIIY